MLERQYEKIIAREKYVEELLSGIVNGEYNSTDAIVFYGQAGIGKSSLSKSLYQRITQYYSNCTIIDGEEINTDYLTSNAVKTTLLQLRKGLLENKSSLSCFDIAYLVSYALENTSQVIDLPLSLAEQTEVLPILELVKKGLYQFPLLLENTKPFMTFKIKQDRQGILLGSKIFACLNWFFIQQTESLRQWWKLQGSQNLQELENCANLEDILKLLPLFLARDLQLHLQEISQQAVVFIDKYEYLADTEGECNWLKDLIQFNPSIFWLIFAEKPLNLTNNTQNILIINLTDAESKAILQKFGIDNSEISQLIIEGSEGIPLYLLLGVETYLTLAEYKTPEVNDFAHNLQEILPQLNAAWDWYERRIWQILSNCHSWDEILFTKLMSQFEIASCNWICDCWKKLFNQVVKSPFVELKPEGVYRLHPILQEYLYHNQPENLHESVNNWLSDYYQAEYQRTRSACPKGLSPLQLNALVKLLEHGLKTQQQQQVIDWFLEQITLQQQVGRHQFTVAILQFLLKHQQNTLALTLLGKSLFALGDYQQALIVLQTVKNLWQTEKIEENITTATVELHLAACYLKLQRTSEADNAAKQALRIYNNLLNHNSVELAELFNIQAEIAIINGYYSEALKLSQQALKIFESHQNIPSLKLIQTKFTTACLNAINKNLDTALNQFKLTLANLADQTHPLAIYCHNLLGNIYQNMGYFTYSQAYYEYKLALETAEINLGLTHPQTLQLITAIIDFSRIRGEYDTVDFFYQRRHGNMEISNFEETPAVADRLNKIGCLLYQQGEYACSENLLQQALQINCKVLSEKHPQTAESFHNLGLIYKSQRRYYTAEVYLKQGLKIRSQILGEKHPITANSLNSLAALYCCMGKYQQAEPLLQQALEICQQNFGEMHPHTATTLNNLAQMYFCQGFNAKSEPIFRRALKICEQVLEQEHPYTKIVESNLNRLQDNL